jgi:hypothetical protein
MIQRFIICLALIAAGAAAAGGVELRLRSSAICPGAIVRLGDVVEIAGDDPAANAQLAAIALFPAPRVGSIREIDRNQVRQLLAISGVELDGIQITGSDFVVVQSSDTKTAAKPAKRSPPPSSVRPASLEMPVQTSKPPAVIPEPPKPLPLVERGDSVTVHSKASGVRVTISGKALRQGALGDEIEVELADKKQKLVGRVAGPQLVEVVAQP